MLWKIEIKVHVATYSNSNDEEMGLKVEVIAITKARIYKDKITQQF